MRVSAGLFAASAFAATAIASAQQPTTFQDPANLRGEQIRPLNGRELPVDQGSRGLEQVLRKLNTRASMMLIVAHPDDEDGGMLTMVSRGVGARVASLTLTRGEGGQNAMTGDFEDALGLIRTQELLSADRYFGADQMFGTEVDFGFSKTKQEAFSKWGHQRVLYDAVRAVRLYRPLVITAVFTGGVTDGHGQHQVSGEIAQEVFKAAGDPHVFPELTREGILPWTPLKVYARVPSFAITEKGLYDYATNQYVAPRFTNYVTGQTTDTAPTADIVVHEGATDPLLTLAAASATDLREVPQTVGGQLSYAQFARIGLGLQRTQIGPGMRLPPAGAFDVGYHRYGSHLPHQPAQETGFFDGIDTSLAGLLSLSSAPPARLRSSVGTLSRQLSAAQQQFDPAHPDALAPALVAAQHDLGALLDWAEKTTFPGKADVLHELRVKQVQLNEALTLALGVELRATVEGTDRNLPVGSTPQVHTTLQIKSPEPVGIFAERLNSGGANQKLLAVDREPTLASSQSLAETLTATPEVTRSPTRPYFFRNSIEQPVYDLRVPSLRNAPATPPVLTAWATLRYRQTQVEIGHIVDAGEQAVTTTPLATLALPGSALALPDDEPFTTIPVRTQPPGMPVSGPVPAGWRLQLAGPPSGSEQLELTAPQKGRSPFEFVLTATPPGGAPVTEGFRPVGYGTLQRTNFYTRAQLHIVPVALHLPRKRRIAYLPGTGDAVPESLASVGLPVTIVRVADLTPQSLARFDSVILGVRTYNAHPDLHGAPTEALLQFARAGGNVVVQYQTAEFTAADAPFPLTLGNAEKVVDENAPVRLLYPQAALVSYPNHITEADFHGWIEERGHGFLSEWDARYMPLTETHDPGAPAEGIRPQAPQRGGLITAPLGRGHWTYCAFALYRQLPEAVPGAFRLMTNLLGLAD